MKNKLLIVLLFVFLIFEVTGCSSKDIYQNNKNDKSANESTKDNDIFGKKVNLVCSVIENKMVKRIVGDYILTNDNKIYILSDKIFSSTNENCALSKINDFSNGFIGLNYNIYNDYIFETKDGQYIVPSCMGLCEEFKFIEVNDTHLNLIKKYGIDNVSFQLHGKTYFISNNELFYISTDGSRTLKSNIDLKNDEVIEYINGSMIKTNKSIYNYNIINTNDCEKYADIECEYKFIENERLTKLMNKNIDKINYIDEKYLIDIDGNLFRLQA